MLTLELILRRKYGTVNLKCSVNCQCAGADRSRFLRGQVDKYSWVNYGSSYLLL